MKELLTFLFLLLEWILKVQITQIFQYKNRAAKKLKLSLLQELFSSAAKTIALMSQLFFTSDHHFGHENIIKFCNRPFDTVREMNEVLIQRWNEKVRKRDTVYHLGDFGLTYKENLATILEQLNGKIHLIVGNHEGAALQNRKRFEWIKEYHELKVKDPDRHNGVQRIILFHYAMRTWRGAGRGNWHLYGHSHGNLPDLADQLCFDVGVDCHDFYPLSYDEVKAIMQKKNWESPFKKR